MRWNEKVPLWPASNDATVSVSTVEVVAVLPVIVPLRESVPELATWLV
jgi:hypothetical protein